MCTLGFCSFILSICSCIILMYVTKKISEKMRNQNATIKTLVATLDVMAQTITNSATRVSENNGENGENNEKTIDA